MVRFEDLMAARVLIRQAPEKRDACTAALDALHAGAPGTKSLLMTLVDRVEPFRWSEARFSESGASLPRTASAVPLRAF